MVTFRVPDMTCGHCASAIARAVASVDKVARIDISIPEKLVSIASTAAESELKEAIQEAGYTPKPLKVEAADRVPTSAGCCCGSRKLASVDVDQEERATSSSCCR